MKRHSSKALSPEQITGYETGQGMGFALAAELNGFPGPKHVVELQGHHPGGGHGERH